MKILSLVLLVGASLLGWHCQSSQDQQAQPSADTLSLQDLNPLFMPNIYSDQDLIDFLDSLSASGSSHLEEMAIGYSRKELRSLKWVRENEMAPSVIAAFRKAFKQKEIATDLAQEWIAGLDSAWVSKETIPLKVHFSQGGKWIFSLGNETELKWHATLYFFTDRNGLMFSRKLNHRYGLDKIESFQSPDGTTIVHFRVNYESGTGVWLWNEHYYEFTAEGVRPVFNHVQNSNLAQFAMRSWWWETSIQSTSPLKLKVVAHISLPDTAELPTPFFSDSTVIEPLWNPKILEYEWPHLLKDWTLARMLSFVHGDTDPYLFLVSFRKELKAGLASQDPAESQRIRNYLQYTVFSHRHPWEETTTD